MSNRRAIGLSKVTTINAAGELMVNAGRYSRGAVICAFEMMGGIETFAEWADENKTEFYTKMFGKTIGRETENKSSDSVEEMLKVLDGEAEDITDQVEAPPPPQMRHVSNTQIKMAEAAQKWADNEPID